MGFPDDVGALEEQMSEQLAVLERTRGGTDDATLRERGDALWTLGEDLLRLGQLEQGVERLGEAAATLWPFASEQPTAVIACSRRATALIMLGRHDDAYEVLADAIERIGLEWSYPALPDLMALVLADLLDLLRIKGMEERATEVADVVLRRYEADDTPTQRIAAGRALRQKAVSAIGRADWAEALALYDELIRRCPVEEDMAVRDSSVEMRLSALTTRGYVLEQLGRRDDALGSYEEALERGKAVVLPGSNVPKILKDAKAGAKRAKSRRRSAWSVRLRRVLRP